MPKLITLTTSRMLIPDQRLRLLDSILSNNRHPLTRADLLRAVNRCLDQPICLSSLDKDIRAIKELLASHPEKVELIKDRNGYHYHPNERFSLFNDEVHPEDVENIKLLLDLARSVLPEFYPEILETAVKVTGRCPSLDVKKVFESTPHCRIRLGTGKEDRRMVTWLMKCIKSRTTVRAEVAVVSGKTVELHVSPLQLLHWRDDALWLACAVDEEDGRRSLKVIPVDAIEETFCSDRPYRRIEDFETMLEHDFKAHMLGKIKRSKNRGKLIV